MVTKLGLLVLVVLVASAVVAALAFGHSTRQGRVAAGPQPGVFLVLTRADGLPKLPPMPVESFSWKLTNPNSFGSATCGAGCGKVEFSDVTLTVPIDSSLPELSAASASGEHFLSGVLIDTWNNAGHLVALKDGFTDVFVKSVEQDNTAAIQGGPPPPPGVQPGGFPMETITLIAEQTGWSYFPTGDTTTTPSSMKAWSVVTNSAVDCTNPAFASECNPS
jgi:type VI protein secretion system component Hcp